MIKILGAVLIVIATSLIGFEVSKKLITRPKHIRDLRAALQILEAEIMYGHSPLKEAVLTLAKQIPAPVSILFSDFAGRLGSANQSVSAAWGESLEVVRKQSELQQKEIDILLQFGETLGRHDRESQQKQIQLALVHLEREEADAVDKQVKYDKMARSLGFFAGLLIAILMM
ncbi:MULTISPECIES: stage III sporulation protein SpoIIIAB [unclassified Bacillus (in: firmicutes)]|jgi:stage III sporulation protein AB|uniref:stage III sporulation protein SpoIIIAB n=1 Tax=unclassified Bacillus (in: firmicutes) TaxID=185979 RepID=UPI00080AE2D3|nr:MULTISPECIES: stage III sporulation protein SpoIIIAB [unclassified Bacillus (in: firmicutes)]OCA86346.1 stage III sporulation protein SpoAB [Bacillus sp. FJAT-27986]